MNFRIRKGTHVSHFHAKCPFWPAQEYYEQDIVHVADTEFVGALTLRGFQQPVPAFRLRKLRD